MQHLRASRLEPLLQGVLGNTQKLLFPTKFVTVKGVNGGRLGAGPKGPFRAKHLCSGALKGREEIAQGVKVCFFWEALPGAR